MENILRISLILLSAHLSFMPLRVLNSVAFHLLTERRDSSERWGPGVWRVQKLMNRVHSPWEDFKRARINQPGGAAVAEAGPPAVSPEASDAPRMPSHTTDWHTDRERAGWTAVAPTHSPTTPPTPNSGSSRATGQSFAFYNTSTW